MLHGWTGDENSMWVFARNFPADYYILAPRAPHPARRAATRGARLRRAGRPLDLMRPSAEALLDLLDGFARAYDLDASSVDVIGFSQGGAMTFTLAWLAPQRIRKSGILAGFAPQDAEAMLRPGMLAGRHVFVAHGTWRYDGAADDGASHRAPAGAGRCARHLLRAKPVTNSAPSAWPGLEQYLQAD